MDVRRRQEGANTGAMLPPSIRRKIDADLAIIESTHCGETLGESPTLRGFEVGRARVREDLRPILNARIREPV